MTEAFEPTPSVTEFPSLRQLPVVARGKNNLDLSSFICYFPDTLSFLNQSSEDNLIRNCNWGKQRPALLDDFKRAVTTASILCMNPDYPPKFLTWNKNIKRM